ncbi:MAG: hypothetical protein HYV62_04960, partial [Candidatus Rokubacteria bacterium]|nr:hypothetical protein [Candidatus Rokubacteria bacterium]
RVQYHYVLVDFLATPAGGTARPGSDARELRWVAPGALAGLDTTQGLEPMIRRALVLDAERRKQEGAG